MKKTKIQTFKNLNDKNFLHKTLESNTNNNTINREKKTLNTKNSLLSSPVYNGIVSKKAFPPLIKTWVNGVYNFNQSLIKNLPSADNIVHKLIKSYFFMNPLWQNLERHTQDMFSITKKRSRLLVRRLRRASLNRIELSKPEIKHTSDKVFINLYIFNKKKNTYLYKLNNIYNNTVQALTLNMKNNNLGQEVSTLRLGDAKPSKRESFFKPITLAVSPKVSSLEGNIDPFTKYNLSGKKNATKDSKLSSPALNSNIIPSNISAFADKQNTNVQNTVSNALTVKNYNSLHSYIMRTNKAITHISDVKKNPLSYDLIKSNNLGLDFTPHGGHSPLKYKSKIFGVNLRGQRPWHTKNKLGYNYLPIDKALVPVIKVNDFNFQEKAYNSTKYSLLSSMTNIKDINISNSKTHRSWNAFYKGNANLNRFLLSEKNRRLVLYISNPIFDVNKNYLPLDSSIHQDIVGNDRLKTINRFNIADDNANNLTRQGRGQRPQPCSEKYNISTNLNTNKGQRTPGQLGLDAKKNHITFKKQAFKTTLRLNAFKKLEAYNVYMYHISKCITPSFVSQTLLAPSLEHEVKQIEQNIISQGLPLNNKSNIYTFVFDKAFNILNKYKLLQHNTLSRNVLKSSAFGEASRQSVKNLRYIVSHFGQGALTSSHEGFNSINFTNQIQKKGIMPSVISNLKTFNTNHYVFKSHLLHNSSKNTFLNCLYTLYKQLSMISLANKALLATALLELPKDVWHNKKVNIYPSTQQFETLKDKTSSAIYNNLTPYHNANKDLHKPLNYNVDKLHISFNALNEYTYISNAFNKLDKFFDKYLAKGLGALALNSLEDSKDLIGKNIEKTINMQVEKGEQGLRGLTEKNFTEPQPKDLSTQSALLHINEHKYMGQSAVTFLRLYYKKKIISKILNLETSYIHYLTLLEFNNSLFKNWFINPLCNIISRIYNKKVIFNIVSLKAMYFNSDILSNLIAIRLNNHKKNRYNKVFKKVLRAVALAKVNEHSYNTQSEIYRSLNKHYQRYNDLSNVIGLIYNDKKSFPLDKALNTSILTSLPKMEKSKREALKALDYINTKNYTGTIHKKLNGSLVNTINFIKHKSVFGIRLEASGRLTKRSTASRKIFKFRYLGNLRLNDIITRKTPAVMVKDKITNNLQFSKISSKTRNGAFGIKGWINQA